MSDDIESAIKNFTNLSDENKKQLVDLNKGIKQHRGPWGKEAGGSSIENGAIEMPYWINDPLIDEFEDYMYTNGLIVGFDWINWGDGRAWFKLADPHKFDKLDVETALKLITAIIRNNRFSDGALVQGFESGELPAIINRLAGLASAPEASK